MADDGIYTSNAQIAVRAGANVNATAITVAETDKYVLEVEASINAQTRTNWSDLVTAGLNADVQGVLTECSACMCAQMAIMYDMSGFSSLLEAQTMLDVLDNRYKAALKTLKEDKEVRRFVETA